MWVGVGQPKLMVQVMYNACWGRGWVELHKRISILLSRGIGVRFVSGSRSPG